MTAPLSAIRAALLPFASLPALDARCAVPHRFHPDFYRDDIGRFAPAPVPAPKAPLLVNPPKRARNVRSEATKREKAKAVQDAMTARLRAEIAASKIASGMVRADDRRA